MARVRGWRRLGRTATGGYTMVEFAIASVVLLMVVFGSIDFGRAIYLSSELNNSVREAAREAKVGEANGFGWSAGSIAERVRVAKHPITNATSNRPGLGAAVVGYAKARVERAVSHPRNAPMMICASGAWDVTGVEGTTAPADGGTRTILNGGQVSQASIGRIFRVVDPNLGKHGDADCGSKDDAFTGITNQGANGGKSVGSSYAYGTALGAADAEAKGADGCAAGSPAPFDCVMILPVAQKGESGTKALKVVGFAPFGISSVDGERVNATLLDDYIVSGDGTTTWCQACGGVVVVRLIW